MIATALFAAPASAVYTPGDNLRSLTHDSLLRDYNVYAPTSYDGLSPVPLVVDLHGAGSDYVQQQGISGWDFKAEEIGFLVVYPDGIANTWNANVCCGGNSEDDVGFLLAMIDAIELEGNVDATRIYVTGLSNGGAMTQRMVCEAADVFAAAAPLAFPVPYDDFATECNPSREIPVLMTMGLTDTVVAYGGGPFAGAVESFAAWRAKSSCGPEPVEQTILFPNGDCEIDTSCAGSSQIGLCSVTGSELPPPFDIYNGHILYLNDDGLVMPDLIWEFWQTGSIEQPDLLLPSSGPLAITALVASLAAAGLLALRHARRRAA